MTDLDIPSYDRPIALENWRAVLETVCGQSVAPDKREAIALEAVQFPTRRTQMDLVVKKIIEAKNAA